jgi:hypothetical protein
MSGQEETSIKENLILLGVAAGIGGSIGALTGLGLSFTALPALAAGAIIAAIPTMLLYACMVYDHYSRNQLDKDDIIYLFGICIAGTAIGVGLAAAATAIFPGVMLGMGSAAGIGALIGSIAPVVGLFVTGFIIEPLVNKVSECFTSPEVEQITSSKRNERAASTL